MSGVPKLIARYTNAGKAGRQYSTLELRRPWYDASSDVLVGIRVVRGRAHPEWRNSALPDTFISTGLNMEQVRHLRDQLDQIIRAAPPTSEPPLLIETF